MHCYNYANQDGNTLTRASHTLKFYTMFSTKPFLIALATACAATIAPSAQATGLMNQHQSLWNDLERVGVTIRVNDPQACRSRSFNGRYISRQRRLDVCQDNYAPYTQTQWTANDLDTLRHEAHHVLQDCTGGNPYDSVLNKFFPDDDHRSFVSNSLTPQQINSVINSYRSKGANDHIVALELEAFSVARTVSADLIGRKLVEFCGVSKM